MFVSTDDLCFLPATHLAADIRARKVSPVDVIDALADRIKRLNPKLTTYVTLDLELDSLVIRGWKIFARFKGIIVKCTLRLSRKPGRG